MGSTLCKLRNELQNIKEIPITNFMQRSESHEDFVNNLDEVLLSPKIEI